MTEKREFWRLLGEWREAAVLIATFGLTLLYLTAGIVAGCLLAAVFAAFGRAVAKEGD